MAMAMAMMEASIEEWMRKRQLEASATLSSAYADKDLASPSESANLAKEKENERQDCRDSWSPAPTSPSGSPRRRRGRTRSGAAWTVSMEGIVEPGDGDCLLGRGGAALHHTGNILYRRMVDDRRESYLSSSRGHKPHVAMEIVAAWRARVPPGRFLERDDVTKLWSDVGDERAREKTCQALREKRKRAPAGNPSPAVPGPSPSELALAKAQAMARGRIERTLAKSEKKSQTERKSQRATRPWCPWHAEGTGVPGPMENSAPEAFGAAAQNGAPSALADRAPNTPRARTREASSDRTEGTDMPRATENDVREASDATENSPAPAKKERALARKQIQRQVRERIKGTLAETSGERRRAEGNDAPRAAENATAKNRAPGASAGLTVNAPRPRTRESLSASRVAAAAAAGASSLANERKRPRIDKNAVPCEGITRGNFGDVLSFVASSMRASASEIERIAHVPGRDMLAAYSESDFARSFDFLLPHHKMVVRKLGGDGGYSIHAEGCTTVAVTKKALRCPACYERTATGAKNTISRMHLPVVEALNPRTTIVTIAKDPRTAQMEIKRLRKELAETKRSLATARVEVDRFKPRTAEERIAWERRRLEEERRDEEQKKAMEEKKNTYYC